MTSKLQKAVESKQAKMMQLEHECDYEPLRDLLRETIEKLEPYTHGCICLKQTVEGMKKHLVTTEMRLCGDFVSTVHRMQKAGKLLTPWTGDEDATVGQA